MPSYDPLEIGEDVVAALKLYMKIKAEAATLTQPVTGVQIAALVAAVAPDIGAIIDQVIAQGKS